MTQPVTPIPTRRMDIYRRTFVCIVSDCDDLDEREAEQ